MKRPDGTKHFMYRCRDQFCKQHVTISTDLLDAHVVELLWRFLPRLWRPRYDQPDREAEVEALAGGAGRSRDRDRHLRGEPRHHWRRPDDRGEGPQALDEKKKEIEKQLGEAATDSPLLGEASEGVRATVAMLLKTEDGKVRVNSDGVYLMLEQGGPTFAHDFVKRSFRLDHARPRPQARQP
jgi:hypothetical protein